jgi:hypothetical protein
MAKGLQKIIFSIASDHNLKASEKNSPRSGPKVTGIYFLKYSTPLSRRGFAFLGFFFGKVAKKEEGYR